MIHPSQHCSEKQWHWASSFAPVLRGGRSLAILLNALLILSVCIALSGAAHATVKNLSVQSPKLSPTGSTNVTTPIHFAATAESDLEVTGYVIYVDMSMFFATSALPWTLG